MSVWPDSDVDTGTRKTGEDDCTADAVLEEISHILSENSKAAVAKWKDDMKNRGLASRWVKRRSIVGVDLRHRVNWADEDHSLSAMSCFCAARAACHPSGDCQGACDEMEHWKWIRLECNCRALRVRLFTP